MNIQVQMQRSIYIGAFDGKETKTRQYLKFYNQYINIVRDILGLLEVILALLAVKKHRSGNI